MNNDTPDIIDVIYQTRFHGLGNTMARFHCQGGIDDHMNFDLVLTAGCSGPEIVHLHDPRHIQGTLLNVLHGFRIGRGITQFPKCVSQNLQTHLDDEERNQQCRKGIEYAPGWFDLCQGHTGQNGNRGKGIRTVVPGICHHELAFHPPACR